MAEETTGTPGTPGTTGTTGTTGMTGTTSTPGTSGTSGTPSAPGTSGTTGGTSTLAITGPVLLVEDDETLASILARHLRTHGYAVEMCSSAESALSALRLGLRPSIVVLDINLPDATGWSLPQSPELKRAGSPPVLIASASAVSSTRLAAAGIAGYLPKPFPMETFMDVIGRLVRQGEEPSL